ncbi:WD40-repeat-containing domain protein [Gaertneriomyces semiglobifer]|nr:WD40-repeat-containing domain protein [Gaertneriomyces semiglobifer]
MMSSDKRKADGPQNGSLVKRSKNDEPSNALAVTPSQGQAQGAVVRTIKRTSDLQAPIMLLEGQQAEVLSVKFSPDGRRLASGGADRMIYLWDAHGECKNYGTLSGHTGAILEVQWSSSGQNIFSASTDKTLGIWDATTGERIKKLKGHTEYINTCAATRRGQDMIVSGSDDGSVKIWDPREKHPVVDLEGKWPVTSVSFGRDEGIVYTGGIDNMIQAWDLRKKEVIYRLAGHLDTVTGLRTSPDGSHLLSTAMDNTCRVWDIKPFSPSPTRLMKILEGAPHGFEKNLLRPCWSPDGDFVACGSGDRSVVVWDWASGRIVYKLPGHKGVVNEVDWAQNVIASGSNDRTVFLGEVNVEEVK